MFKKSICLIGALILLAFSMPAMMVSAETTGFTATFDTVADLDLFEFDTTDSIYNVGGTTSIEDGKMKILTNTITESLGFATLKIKDSNVSQYTLEFDAYFEGATGTIAAVNRLGENQTWVERSYAMEFLWNRTSIQRRYPNWGSAPYAGIGDLSYGLNSIHVIITADGQNLTLRVIGNDAGSNYDSGVISLTESDCNYADGPVGFDVLGMAPGNGVYAFVDNVKFWNSLGAYPEPASSEESSSESSSTVSQSESNSTSNSTTISTSDNGSPSTSDSSMFIFAATMFAATAGAIAVRRKKARSI